MTFEFACRMGTLARPPLSEILGEVGAWIRSGAMSGKSAQPTISFAGVY